LLVELRGFVPRQFATAARSEAAPYFLLNMAQDGAENGVLEIELTAGDGAGGADERPALERSGTLDGPLPMTLTKDEVGAAPETRGADTPTRRGSLKIQSSYGPAGTKATSPQTVMHRRLSFADEHGKTLAKVTYSARLHYSNEGAAEPGAKLGGCCVIS